MGYLILVRHGESRWNKANKFTGWVDVPLSEGGIHEALICAKELAGLRIDVAFTSRLVRAQETLLLILAKQDATGIFLHRQRRERAWSSHPHLWDLHEIPVHSDSALNERYYGRLQGTNKDFARKKWGEEQVFLWRRSYAIAPPGGESLRDTCRRAVPYFTREIMPQVKKGRNVLVVAHGNSLRAIIKHLDKISDEDIPHLELPMGKPIVYVWTGTGLVKDNHVHSFDRPVHWTAEKSKTPGSTKTGKIKKTKSQMTTAKKTTKKTVKKSIRRPVRK